MNNDKTIIEEIKSWLESVVLGLNFCPFAKVPFEAGRVSFQVSHEEQEEGVLQDLFRWLQYMDGVSEQECETLLLILPYALLDFEQYNQFLDIVDSLIEVEAWEGVFQIASFHPDYQFAGADVDDVTNYTNRAPYPILHILRESSISRAVRSEDQIEQVIERNQKTLRNMPKEQFRALFFQKA